MSISDTLAEAEALLETEPAEAIAPFEAALHGDLPDVATEAQALLGLGRAYGRSGRFFEAVVMGRRLVMLERGRGTDGDLITALGLLVVALLNARAIKHAEPVLDELEAQLANVAPEEAPELFRILHQARYSIALTNADTQGAGEHLERLRDLSRDGWLGDHAHWFLLNIEFHLALARDDVERMETILSEVLDTSGVENVYVPAITLRRGLALAYAKRGRLDEARALVNDAIEYLLGRGGGSEVLIDDAAALAQLLHSYLDESGAALVAANLATAGLLERIRQIEESARTLAPLLADDDRELLTGMQGDFRTTILTFLREVQSVLREATGSHTTEAPPGEEDIVLICAWCGCVRLARDTWAALAQFVPRKPLSGVSHGICPPCRKRELEDFSGHRAPQ